MIKAYEDLDRGSLIGIKKPDTHPYLCYKYIDRLIPVINPNPDRYFSRQSYPPYYEISHYACIIPLKDIHNLNAQLMNDNTYGYPVPDTVDIDTLEDFEYAEYLMRKR